MTRQLKQPSHQAQAIALVDAIARGKNLTVGAKATTRQVLQRIRELTQPNPILMHGKRVESMFAFVVAALGRCVAIREEDVGAVYGPPGIQPPDYRVVFKDNTELLIEVKNCHETTRPLRLKTEYLDGLLAYGRLFNRPVKLAIYWSKWKAWTLIALDHLKASARHSTINFPAALMANEMVSLGDYTLGTTPPLALRLHSDPSEPRTVMPNQRRISFRIGNVELFCGGRLVRDKQERAIAWHLMMFGRWPKREQLEIRDNELLWLDYIAEPESVPGGDANDSVPFRMAGEASSLISRQCDFRTLSMSGEIQRLRPLSEPSKFGIAIPADYRGRDVTFGALFCTPEQPLNETARFAIPLLAVMNCCPAVAALSQRSRK
jgi:hypothetical protein